MDIILTPAKLNGTIQARPSVTDAWLHSVAQELALLQRKRHLLPSRRGVAPRDLLKMKGCWSSDMETTCACFKCFTEDVPVLYCADSRHTLNLMLPIASALKKKVYFTGDISLADNHIIPLTDTLHRHGPSATRGELKIRRRDRGRIKEICTLSGRLTHGSYSLTGKEDPCFIAGLLFALPLLEGNSSLHMTTMPVSTELMEMTLAVMEQYGVKTHRSVDEYGYPHYDISGNQQYTIPEELRIDGDWKRAAFWLGCGALGGNVTVKGLDGYSPQNARQILDKLHSMGAGTGIGEGGANVTAVNLHGCNINASRIPDLIPILAVAMSVAEGTSMLTDTAGYDLDAVFHTLDILEADISYGGAGLSFTGRAVLSGGEVDPKGDPLIILIASAASCVSRLPVTIRNAGIINKVYPGFFEDFAALGGKVTVDR